MTHQNQPATAFEDRLNGRQSHAHAQIVGHLLLIVERDVEVNPHENSFSGDINVCNRLLRHGNFLEITQFQNGKIRGRRPS